MKKILLAALSVVLTVASCQKNEIPEPRPRARLHAQVEQVASTKTTMDADRNILWSEGDQVIAFMKTTLGSKFQVTSESVGKTSAHFDEVVSRGGGLNSGNEISHNVVYYPYSSSVMCRMSGGDYSLSVDLPSEQTYVEGSFGNGAMSMVAVSETNNITFRNVLGGMKLQLKGSQKVTSINLQGKKNEKLSGAAVVTAYADGETKPVIAMSQTASTSVTLNCGSGVQLSDSKATPFIIALPPVLFSEGFTVTITDADGKTYTVDTDKANEVRRSSLLVMPEVTLEESEKPKPDAAPEYIDEYGINHGPGVEIDDVIWAPVNCGYHATDYPYGKLYQWGRKYGQGYSGYDYNLGKDVSDVTIPEFRNGGVSLLDGQSEDNENVLFLSYPVNNNDWLHQSDDTLWNIGTESDPVKTEYDPCPDGWRVPTHAELDELSKNNSSWITNDKNQPGYWFSGSSSYTSSVPQVFFPAAGFRFEYNGVAYSRGFNGNYWSSSPSCDETYDLYIHTDNASVINDSRAYSFSVRCVQDDVELIPVSSVTLNETSLLLNEGENSTLSVTISPSNANHKAAHWWSDDPSVASVDESGKVTAVSAGTATITAMAGMQTATCTVTVRGQAISEPQEVEYIDEYGINHGPGVGIDGVIWAPVNCGYHETDYPWGKLYQWGRKYGQGYDGGLWDCNGGWLGEVSDAMVPEIMEGGVSLSGGQSEEKANVFFLGDPENDYDWVYPSDGTLWNSDTEEEPVKTEYDPCPDGWRVPTYSELDDLRQNKSSWTTNDKNQEGYWLSGQSSYTSSVPQVFFPAAGFLSYYDGGAGNRGYDGCYCSSRPNDSYAYLLYFYSGYTSMGYNYRAYGCSVRCVQITDEVAEL